MNKTDQTDQTDLRARLHHDETGAQAMEYAALAGGGITAVSLITWILNSQPVREQLENLVIGLVQKLGESLSGVIPFL